MIGKILSPIGKAAVKLLPMSAKRKMVKAAAVEVALDEIKQLKERYPMDDLKPGYKTTEFWLTTAAGLLSALFASGVLGSGSVAETIAGVVAFVLAKAGYAVSRGLAKKV